MPDTETSVLYGAYVAGLILAYISKPPVPTTSSGDSDDPCVAEELKFRQSELSFEESFARMIGPLQNYLLLPLFFASIGFAIVSYHIGIFDHHADDASPALLGPVAARYTLEGHRLRYPHVSRQTRRRSPYTLLCHHDLIRQEPPDPHPPSPIRISLEGHCLLL